MPLKIKSDTFHEYIYDKFPQVYQRADTETDLSLYRYIRTLCLAMGDLTDEISGLWDAFDPVKCPSRLFPALYECFGLPYFQDIPEEYQRKILTLIGELYMRKGTKGAVEFLAKELTGFDAELIDMQDRYFKTWSPDFPQSAAFVPSILNPNIGSDTDIKLMDFRIWHDADSGGYYTPNAREVIIKLSAKMEDATLMIRELVFIRFLKYFLPFDLFWTIQTNYYYEEEFDVTNSISDDGWQDIIREQRNENDTQTLDDNSYDTITTDDSDADFLNRISRLNNSASKLNGSMFLNMFGKMEESYDVIEGSEN